MSKIKLIVSVACLSLFAGNSAWAQHGWHHHHHRHFYGPPIYAYPPVIAPPPVVVAPPPAFIAPPQGYFPQPPVYAPPTYTYGTIGPGGSYGFGYASPGFGIYFGR